MGFYDPFSQNGRQRKSGTRPLNHTQLVKALQERYRHLMNLPLPDIKDGQHLILNGSDKSHFITPVKQVCLNPPGGLVTVFTRLWLDATSPSRELKKTAFCGLVTVTRHSDTRHQPVQSLPRTPEGHHTQLLHGAAGGPDPPQCHRLPKGRVCKLCFPANFRR